MCLFFLSAVSLLIASANIKREKKNETIYNNEGLQNERIKNVFKSYPKYETKMANNNNYYCHHRIAKKTNSSSQKITIEKSASLDWGSWGSCLNFPLLKLFNDYSLLTLKTTLKITQNYSIGHVTNVIHELFTSGWWLHRAQATCIVSSQNTQMTELANDFNTLSSQQGKHHVHNWSSFILHVNFIYFTFFFVFFFHVPCSEPWIEFNGFRFFRCLFYHLHIKFCSHLFIHDSVENVWVSVCLCVCLSLWLWIDVPKFHKKKNYSASIKYIEFNI